MNRIGRVIGGMFRLGMGIKWGIDREVVNFDSKVLLIYVNHFEKLVHKPSDLTDRNKSNNILT